MFELTGGLTYIVPIMIAVMIAKWVGDAIISDGMYPTNLPQIDFTPSLHPQHTHTHTSLSSNIASLVLLRCVP